MPRLLELQDSVKGVKPKRTVVRYSEEEWRLLGQAMWLEWSSPSVSMSTTIVQLANLAQKNQLKFLLGSDVESGVQWPVRRFTAVVQLQPAVEHMFRLVKSVQDNETLFLTASDDNTKLQKQLKELETKVLEFQSRRPSLSEFSQADIVAEAASIQASQAERMERVASTFNKGFEEIKVLINNHTSGNGQAMEALKVEFKGVIEHTSKLLAERFAAVQKDKPMVIAQRHDKRGKWA